MFGVESAVRPLRAAAILALREANTDAGNRIFTPPVAEGTPLPYVTISNYSERHDNFAGRAGSIVGFDVHGYVFTRAGDKDLVALMEQCYATLHRVPLNVGGHLYLIGTMLLRVTYTDPADANLLHFVFRYEGMTRNA